MAHPAQGSHRRPESDTRPTGADRVRHVVVSVSAVLAILGAMVGSGALGGESMPEAAGGAFAADATHVAPAGPAFSIWSVIYIGLVAYAVWQWLPAPAAAERHRRVGFWIAASMLLNAVWLLVVQAALLWLSLAVMAVLLVVLVIVLVELRSRPSTGVVDTIVTDGTAGLYLGWIVVATVANVAAVLAEAGLRESVSSPGAWAVAVLAVAGLVGSALALWSRGRLAPSVAICWGLAWVGVARLTGDLLSGPAAYAAIAAAAVVAIVTVSARLRRARTTVES
ncbi:tryptophan-rich sensory protein [Georgenia sp. Z1491]|uniref:tryptophan-rich sensory protein n=1 Tax=Georgenia sp. Z1491 TaxID=3416707 RepID=UPI003CE82818